jgi:hypothetical protein
MIFYSPAIQDPYEVAQNNDWIDTDYYRAGDVLLLKKINPQIKIYLYYNAGAIADYRQADYTDSPKVPFYMKFQDAITNHPEWFYDRYDRSGGGKVDMTKWYNFSDTRVEYKKCKVAESPCSELNTIDYFFSVQYQYIYAVNPEISSYQEAWEADVIKYVKYFAMDGVFVDTLGETGAWEVSKPGLFINPDSVQNFETNVYPNIRNAGIEIIQNACTAHYSTYSGNIHLNPTWKKSELSITPPSPELSSMLNNFYGGVAPTDDTFLDNNADTTPDQFFQEWAFFTHNDSSNQNQYDLDYWLLTLDDLDRNREINSLLPDNRKKTLFDLVLGVDKPDDPALGKNGWAEFGLASYLLNNSDYTLFGVVRGAKEGDPTGTLNVPLNYLAEQTESLGQPVSDREILTGQYSDKSLQTRQFENGLVVVNGNDKEERSFNLSEEMYDEDGALISAGTLTLPKHSGRILTHVPSTPLLSIGHLLTYKNSVDLNFQTVGGMEKLYITGNEAEGIGTDTWKKTVDLSIGKNNYLVKALDKYGKFSKELSVELTRLKMADSNNDGAINIKDFSIILANWGTPKNYLADFNEDGSVNIKDFSVLMANWGE